MDDALSQSQAHTGSFKFIVVVQPLEDPEKLFRVLRIEPNAVVFDVIDVVFCVASTADFNHGAFPPLSELNRVGQQMNQNLAKQKRITPGLREGPEVKLRPWIGTSGDELLKDKVNSLVNQGHKKIVLNLAGVPYIDSAGLGEIVRTYTTVSRQGGSLKLLNLTKRITDLLSITKLLTVFETFDSENEAVKSFSTSAQV